MLVNKDILDSVFAINIDEIVLLDPEAVLDDSIGWDSMAKVMLIAEISDKFDAVLEADDLENIITLAELDNLITQISNQ
ncbi:acyl carrier protein [Gammaproteobacteria bacterium]|nr:acyl carrier protein [Gammaproteobacteria bacterium]MDB9841942.1 acyl carrier protein [Gammaproteobacteria bacterium]